MGCLYRLTFPGGKGYIGITVGTAEARFSEHVYNAQTQRADRAVNRALRKYGAENVKLETLVIAGWDYLVELERKAIAAFGTFGRGGYNMTAGGEGALGYKHTPESLLKMGAVHKGKAHHTRPHSAEAKAKMSRARLGKCWITPEGKAKIGAAARGNQYALGRVQPEEERARRSAAAIGTSHGGKSGHVGVSFNKRERKWIAHLTVRRKFINLGRHDTLEEAIAARKAGVEKHVWT